MIKTIRYFILVSLVFLSIKGDISAQPYNYAFTSGPIPMCDTSIFTANVSGIGTLYPPGTSQWNFSLQSLGINITSNHPQTLQIFLTSPQGTTLLLSEFNGAGGSNYTNCNFLYSGAASITTGAAPFTGNWLAQGGSFSVFDYENGDGTWIITIIDTACGGGGGGGGGGGPWIPGWFDGSGGGSGGFTIDFSLPPPPPCWGGIPSNSVNICAGQTVDILGWYTSGAPGYTYNFMLNGNSVPNPSAVTVGGSYFVEAYDPWDGCLYWAYFDVIVYPQAAIGPDQAVNTCLGSPVNLTSLFTLSGLTAVWSLNGSPITGAAAAAANTPGLYQVIGQNPAGCNDTAMVTLNITTGPNLGADQSLSICTGNSVDLTLLYNTIGYTADWYFGGNPFTTVNAASAAGVYTLISSDGSNCADTAEVTLTVNVMVQLGPDQIISGCNVGAYDLTQLYNTTGLTATWYLSGSPVANPAAVTATGTYTLMASSGIGCADTALVTLNFSPGPNLGADQSVSICPGVSQNLSSLYSTGVNTVAWYFSGSPFANPASAVTAGVYTLIATTPGGCTDTAQVTLIVNPAPAIGVDQNISGCITGNYNLTPLYSTTGLIATWYLNGNPVANPGAVSANGTYVLVAVNATGCADTAQVVLNVSQSPVLGADQNVSSCSGVPVDLTALYSTGANSAAWYFSGTGFATPASAITAGVYTLIVTTAGGCTDTAEVTLAVQPAPVLGADQTETICSNTTLDLTGLYTTTGLTADWTFMGSPVVNPAAVLTAGVYTLVAGTSAGCTDTAMVSIVVLQAPVLGPDQAPGICAGNTVDLTTLYTTTGFTAAWTSSGVPVADPTAVGTSGTFTLIAISTAGCTDTALVNVNVAANPVLGADQSVTACDGSIVNLSLLYNTSGNIVSWTTGGNPVPDPAAVSSSGIYTVTVTNPSGCTVSANATLVFNTSPSLGADQSAAICNGTTADLTAIYALSGLTASWTVSGTPVPDPTLVNAAGNYQLVVTNSFGCTDTAVINVTVNTGPSLGNDQSFALCPWQTVDLSAVFPVSGLTANYELNGNVVANFTAVYDSGMYVVTVTDLNGCTDEAIASVSNVVCLCIAEFDYSGRCIQDPIQFELLADSVLISAHWNFGGASADQFVSDPQVKFNTDENVIVTLEALLSCGLVTVRKELKMTDCADSCQFYLPSAFTPNGDGRNDTYSWYGECGPEEFSMEIYNRFGQLVFSSVNPYTAWDGKYENAESPSGIYVYQIAYRLPYQKKQLRTGTMSVMR